MERGYIKKAIECIILISEKPVSVKSLLQVFPDLHKEALNELLAELMDEWNGLDRGFRLYEVACGYQFRTSSQYSDFIIRFRQSKPFRLSRAALEVLAIIAYRQPITRIEIEQIRGVDSSGVINLLLEKRLITIRGRKEVPGRPFMYGTTQEFLETFGLKGLTDLPTLKELDEIEKSIQLADKVE
ncbi:MAG TPA: SMC-Scp complex subunit ScpB [Thermodesulfobacteriota bacterium]|nr:SMC-Scp complex subunit ScpB [Thermodesulfobacteriota bacterium]